MKSLTRPEKHNMTARFSSRWLDDLRSRKIQAVVDQTFPLNQAALAQHQFMEQGQNFGKIVLMA